jgi:hypothetical protein
VYTIIKAKIYIFALIIVYTCLHTWTKVTDTYRLTQHASLITQYTMYLNYLKNNNKENTQHKIYKDG